MLIHYSQKVVVEIVWDGLLFALFFAFFFCVFAYHVLSSHVVATHAHHPPTTRRMKHGAVRISPSMLRSRLIPHSINALHIILSELSGAADHHPQSSRRRPPANIPSRKHECTPFLFAFFCSFLPKADNFYRALWYVLLAPPRPLMAGGAVFFL